jgi:CRISPR-associated protein Cas5d
MPPYPLELEISGPTAMWTRPDTGSSPVSYVAPTFSAVKGIFESILRWKSVRVRPVKAEICRPVQFHRYATNCGGPLRASDAMAKGASFQLFAMVLVNVCYRLHAEVDWHRGPNGEPAEAPDGQCAPHAFQDAFNRRLKNGEWFYTPCLGCCFSPASFAGEGGQRPGEGGRWHNQRSNSTSAVPDYVGPFRDGTAPCATENHVIPASLEMVFKRPQNASNDSLN